MAMMPLFEVRDSWLERMSSIDQKLKSMDIRKRAGFAFSKSMID